VISAIDKVGEKPTDEPIWTLPDSWIWARMKQVVNNVNDLFESYQFGEAGKQIYEFLWNDYADWYVEISKRQLAQGGPRAYYTAYSLARILDTMLRLLHPYTPYVTEALWGYLKKVALRQVCQLVHILDGKMPWWWLSGPNALIWKVGKKVQLRSSV